MVLSMMIGFVIGQNHNLRIFPEKESVGASGEALKEKLLVLQWQCKALDPVLLSGTNSVTIKSGDVI